jgi:hypothetical protein
LNDETGRLLLDVGCLLDFSPSGIVRLVQSLGLCFYPHLKCLKRFIVLLPGAAVRVAEDLRMCASLSLTYDAIASRREYGFPNDPHPYTRTPGQPLSSPPFVTDDLPQFAHGSMFRGFGLSVSSVSASTLLIR